MNLGLLKLGVVGALVLGLVATSAHSSGVTSAVKRLGSSGAEAVSGPTSATAVVTWQTFNNSGQVTVAKVTWTPASNANYVVSVFVLNSSGTVLSSGSASVTGSGTSQRNDNVTLAAAVTITSVASVKVRIAGS